MRAVYRIVPLVFSALFLIGSLASARAAGTVWECTIQQSLPVTAHARIQDARMKLLAAEEIAQKGLAKPPVVPTFTFDQDTGMAHWGRYRVVHRIHVATQGQPILASAYGGDWYLEIQRNRVGNPFTWHASGVYLAGRCRQ